MRKIKRAQVSRMLRARETPRVALLMPVSGAAGVSKADVNADAEDFDVDVADMVVDSANMPVSLGGEEVNKALVVESVVWGASS
jgi:hypothetical protein